MNQSSPVNTKILRGYAAVFNSLSQPMIGFREIIRPGAFTETLRESDVRSFWNHDYSFVLGRTSARTLFLEEDSTGLLTRILPPNTQWARDLVESVDRGDVSQMSFGFVALDDRWLPAGRDGLPIRELLRVKLLEVSIVAVPAYLDTSVKVQLVRDPNAGQRSAQPPQTLDVLRYRLRLLEVA